MRTTTIRPWTLVATTLALGALAAPARAADQHVFGKLVMVKNNLDPAKRRVKYLGKEIASNRTVQGNPLSGGATFTRILRARTGRSRWPRSSARRARRSS